MRVKSVLVLLLMCILLTGQIAYAEDNEAAEEIVEADDMTIEENEDFAIKQEENEENSAVDSAAIFQDSCGENLKWIVNGTSLTITGTGVMDNYETQSVYGGSIETNVPWKDYMGSITNVIIGEGVTAVGDCAFSDFSNLSTVELPDSLTRIGSKSFARCTSLVSIHLPDRVTYMGSWAFGGCSALAGVDVPEGITFLSESVFSACTALEEVYLPGGLTRIGPTAFNSCKRLRTIQLPDGLGSIGSGAFCFCDSLEEIQLPQTVTSIGSMAFCGCKSLKKLELPDDLTSLEREVFSYCSALTEMSIPASVVTIGDLAFRDCNSLKDIYIYAPMVNSYGNNHVFPDNPSTVIHCLENSGPESYLKYYGYNYCFIPGSQKEIQAEAAGYKGSYDGKGHQISVSVKNMSSDQYVIYYSDNENLYEKRFTQTEKPIEVSNAGVHTIYYYVCADGYPIKKGSADIVIEPLKASLQFQDRTVEKRIYSDSFINPITAVTTERITYSSSDESVAAVDDSGKVTIKGSGSCTITASSEAGNYTAASASYVLKVAEPLELKILQHPKDVTGQLGEEVTLQVDAIGEELRYEWRYSFDGKVSDTSYYLYRVNAPVLHLTLTDKLADATFWCHITDRFGNEANTEACHVSYTIKEGYVASGVCGGSLSWTLDEQGVLEISGSGEMKSSPWKDEKYVINKVIIQSGVSNVMNSAFYGCYIKEISIPDSVTSIGDGAFYDCGWLKEIVLPAGLEELGEEAFGRCENLGKVIMTGDAPKNTSPWAFEPYEEWRYGKRIIYVPEGAKGYEEKPWSDYEVVYVGKGDVNEDGSVNIEDLRIILRKVCGKIELTEHQMQIADVEKDGKVDIQDLRKILRFVCGKLNEL